MAKNLLVGVGGKARKVKALYVGAGGKARKVKKVYVGVGGKARLVYTSYVAVSSIDLILPDDTTQLTATITAKFTPNDATNQKVTWKYVNTLGAGIIIRSTTDTTCTLSVQSTSDNIIGILTATAANGISVSKGIIHNNRSFIHANGTWSWT